MMFKSQLEPRGETVSARPEIRGVSYGHLSVQNSTPNDAYVQTMLQRPEPEFYNQVSRLPQELREGIFSAHEKLIRRSKERGNYDGVKRLEENVSNYLELRDIEDRLIEKENKVCEAFTKVMPLDNDIKEWVKGNYTDTQEYRNKFKEAVEGDEALYGRLERVNSEFGLTSNDLGLAAETLYTNLSMAPDSPLDRKGLVREVLGTGVIMQSGEYPVKRKGGIGDIVPVDKGEKEHIGRKRIFAAVGTAALLGAGATAVYDQVAHGDPLYHAKSIAKELGNMFSGGGTDQNNNVPTEYQNWTIQYFGSLNNFSGLPECDSDGDYVDNLFEFQNGTDPTKPFTYQGLDDFNLLYTYPQYFTNVSERNVTQKQINEFLTKIPNVEPRYWNATDGTVYGNKPGKYVNVSLRDPLFQHLVKNVSIDWEKNEEYGKIGHLKLGKEPLFLEYGNPYKNATSIAPPVYYLANERAGTCGWVATAHTAILVSKGYPCSMVSSEFMWKGRITPHASLESSIDGEIYIVNFNEIFPRIDKNGNSTYEKWGWNLLYYDPNWLENGNFGYM